MHVQPEAALQQRLRDQQAVRADDDRVGRDVDALVELRRLRDGDAEPFGHFLRRCRLQRAPASARLVGAGQQQRDLVVLRKPFEHVGAERRRGGDRDPRH
jgi:hypothetical protein